MFHTYYHELASKAIKDIEISFKEAVEKDLQNTKKEDKTLKRIADIRK